MKILPIGIYKANSGATIRTAALLAKKLEVQKLNVSLIYSGNNIAENT